MAYGFGYILACVNSVWLNLYQQGDNAIIWYRVRILPHLYQTLSLGAPLPKPPTVTYFRSTSYEVTRTQIQVRSTTLTTGVTSIVITTAAPSPTVWPTYQPLPTLSLFGFEVPQVLTGTTSTQPFSLGYNGYNTNNPMLLLCIALAFYCIVSLFFAIIGWVWRTAFAPWFTTSPRSRPQRPRHTTPPPDYSASSRAPWYDNFRKNCYVFCIETWNSTNFILTEIQYLPFRDLTVNTFRFILTMMWTIGCMLFWVVAIPTFYASIIAGVLIVLADAVRTKLEKHLKPRFGGAAMQFWWKVKYRPMCEVALGMKVERTSDNHTPRSKLRRIIVMFYIIMGTVSRRDLRVPPPSPPKLYQFNPYAYRDIPKDPEEIIADLMKKLGGAEDVQQAIEKERDEARDAARAASAESELRLKKSFSALHSLTDEYNHLRSTYNNAGTRWWKDQGWYLSRIDDLKNSEKKAKDNLSEHLKAVKEAAEGCINCKEVKAQMEQIAGSFSVSQQEFSDSTSRAQKAEAELTSTRSTNQQLQTSNQELQTNNQELLTNNQKLQTNNKQLQTDVQQLNTNVKNLKDCLQKETTEKEIYLEKAKRIELELFEGRCPDTTNIGNTLQNDADQMHGLLNDVDHQIQQQQLQQEQQLQGQQLVVHNPGAASPSNFLNQLPDAQRQSHQGHQFQQQQNSGLQQSVWAVKMEEDQPQPAPMLGFHRIEAPQPAMPAQPAVFIPGIGMIGPNSVQALQQQSQQPTAALSFFPPGKLNIYPSTGPSIFAGNSSNRQPLQQKPAVEAINPFSVPPKSPQRNPWAPVVSQPHPQPQTQTPTFKVPTLPASATREVRLQPLQKKSWGPPPAGIRRNGPIPFN